MCGTKKPEQIRRDDPTWYLDFLADFVLANGEPGSRLVKAFTTFREQLGRDKPTWGVEHLCGSLWVEAGLEEQRRILNGWQPNAPPASAAEATAWVHRSPVEALLHIEVMADGELSIEPRYEPTAGSTDPVRLLIRAGTAQATVMGCLRVIVAAVEGRWAEAVGLKVGECLGISSAEARGAGEATAIKALAEVEQAMRRVKVAMGGLAAMEGADPIFAATPAGQDFKKRLLEALRLERDGDWPGEEIIAEVTELRERAYSAEREEITERQRREARAKRRKKNRTLKAGA